jgi:uncharacterized protein (DUF697 family)
MSMIPHLLKKYTMSDFNKSNRDESADSIIKNHMIWSMGAGLIPIPIADIFAVSAIQLDMIRQLARVYEVDFKHTEGKAYIATLTSSSLARLGARAVKFIPGIGSILGGVTMAALSGGSTYAIGEVFKKHFETGGTFLDFDPERLKKYYNEKFEKGKEMAAELQKSKEKESQAPTEGSAPSKSSDPMTQLKELAGMKSAGLLTDEEFEAMKKKIIEA